MRIRSIRPEFWSSEDVAAMTWDTRLVFIGLWSYVDDNGVGRDIERLITTALFPLDGDLPEASRRVTGALRHLSDHGQITRYAVDGKAYLHIKAWARHQRIEKASLGRYPLPTCDNAQFVEGSPTTPGMVPDMSAPGEGEKGRRGEGEKGTKQPSATAAPKPQTKSSPSRFDEFWKHYPRKLNKADAAKAYASAIKRADEDDIIAGVLSLAADPNLPVDRTKIPHPKTWLSGDRWNNPPYDPELPSRASPPRQSTAEQRAATGWNLVQQLRAEEETEYLNHVLEIGPAS